MPLVGYRGMGSRPPEPPTEYDLYKKRGPAFEKAWNHLDEHMGVAPSWEVFWNGYVKFARIRTIDPVKYAERLVEWYRNPERGQYEF